MKPLADCALYTFIDSAYLRGRSVEELALQLCAGGSDLIQLRAKDWPVEKIRLVAEKILPITRAHRVGLVINDHLHIAEAVNAELCHLGQEDLFDSGFKQVSELKRKSERARIGLSTHSPEQAERAVRAGADYIAIGPVFKTGTKPNANPVTLEYVRWAAMNINIPWFAIGGITLGNIEEVRAAGARAVCVVSAILNRDDVTAACREFRERLQ